MHVVKKIGVATGLYCAAFILAYFVVAYPYMSLSEVWDSRGSRDGGSIVITFSIIFWLFSLGIIKLTSLVIVAIRKA